ncbi:MAG: M20 family metallopeptidase [bacterium]|nr:M20 family metallopeptidase [bacterium]
MSARLYVGLFVGLCTGSAYADLDAPEEQIRASLQERSAEMQSQLRHWVGLNTGSFNLAGLEQFSRELEQPLVDLGFEVEIRPGPEIDYPGRGKLQTAPIVLARRGSSDPEALHLLLNGHYDTVFEPDSAFTGYRIDERRADRAMGPGVSDMKGGLVVLMHTLRALADSGDLERIRWTVLLVGDEEIGSLASRPIIEEMARSADYGFVFESSRESGAMVRSRRGLGQFFITVEGRASHAGSAHAEGRSAIRELAHEILAIEALTDYDRGVTLNIGTANGGSKRNIVPERATAWVDVRYDAPDLGEQVRERLEEITSQTTVEGTRAEIWGTLHRPPKIETEAVRRLLSAHEQVAEDLGAPTARAIHAGGGTDGSLMAGVGLAVLDSMGSRGGFAHTDREFVILSSLPERAALAALLFRRLLYLDGSER